MDAMEVLSQFLQVFLMALLPVLASLAAAYLGAKLKVMYSTWKQDHVAESWILEEIARMAVQAAEQANVSGLINDKKAYAYDIIEKQLAAKGLNIDLDVIGAAIEAAVWNEFNSPKVINEQESKPE